MSDPAFIAAEAVRAYMELNAVASSSKYTDATIGSNIRAASGFLQRKTHRQFADQTATKLFTTQGRTSITIPGLRTATAISLQSTTLTPDSTYWLVPDTQQTGVYTAIQFRGFGGQGARGYLSNPEWFDRNLDRLWGGGGYSLPNDLSIAGSWGYTAANLPEPLLHATKVLAAWYTVRPDSVLADVSVTAEGTVRDYGEFPPEVIAFITDWMLVPDQVVVT